MRLPARWFALAALALLAVVGCGGAASHSPSVSRTPPPTKTQQGDNASLERSVRAALRDNARLSSYVLWNNAVPSWASHSTDGPALRALRRSAAGRRARGVQVRSLSQRVEVLSIRLDPSYLVATARVRESGRVVPYRHGRRLGRAVRLDEIARVELHRAGNSSHFLVWKVAKAS